MLTTPLALLLVLGTEVPVPVNTATMRMRVLAKVTEVEAHPLKGRAPMTVEGTVKVIHHKEPNGFPGYIELRLTVLRALP